MCAAPTDPRQARHLSLPGFGESRIKLMREASVLIIGVGGTGCAASSALAAAGVGKLSLNDFDHVEASNLARQTLFTPKDIGQYKTQAAAKRLSEQNPAVHITGIEQRLDQDALGRAVSEHDVILDCSDNFATRFAINEACVSAGRALVSGSAIRWEGQLAVFGPDYSTSACYRCVYADDDESLEDCSGAGVIAPLPTTIGTMMATEAIKLITGLAPSERMLLYDANEGHWRALKISKRNDCPVCSPLSQ